MRPKARDLRRPATSTRLNRSIVRTCTSSEYKNLQGSNEVENTGEKGFKTLQNLIESDINTGKQSTESRNGGGAAKKRVKGASDVLRAYRFSASAETGTTR